MNTFKYILLSMRPSQWTKNGLLFAGLVFSGRLTNPLDVAMSLRAFLIFCVGSGCIYIFNDIIDREKDLAHPYKKKRPIASGQLPELVAEIVAVILMSLSVALSYYLFNTAFFIVYFTYLIFMVAYILMLKHVVILDIIIVASGFVLRAIAGAVVLSVEISPWLIICTFLMALFMLMGKRRHELIILNKDAHLHRSILSEYSLEFIDQMIAIVTSCTIMAYCLYTFAEQTVLRLNTNLMPLTIPFVMYGIFRYLYLTHKKNLGGSPELLIIKDIPMLINILLWIACSSLIIYKFGML